MARSAKRVYITISVVGRCRNHLATLLSSSPWPKTLLLPLELLQYFLRRHSAVWDNTSVKLRQFQINSCVWRHAKQLPVHQSTIWLLHLTLHSYSGKVKKRLRPDLDIIICDTKTELRVFLTQSALRGLIKNEPPSFCHNFIIYWPLFCARQHICCKRAYAIAIPSVRPSHGWFMQKRLKIGSCSFHPRVAPSL